MFVEPKPSRQTSVDHFLDNEHDLGVDTAAYYQAFGARVEGLKKSLMTILASLREENKSIAGYGAAAKANTLMSYCGIGDQHLDFIADKNPFKQGRYMSGNALPICDPRKITETTPDYLLILAWNFADEIIAQQSDFRQKGGKFIIPVPEPHIVS